MAAGRRKTIIQKVMLPYFTNKIKLSLKVINQPRGEDQVGNTPVRYKSPAKKILPRKNVESTLDRTLPLIQRSYSGSRTVFSNKIELGDVLIKKVTQGKETKGPVKDLLETQDIFGTIEKTPGRSKYQMLMYPEIGLRGIIREKAPRPWVKTREQQIYLGQQSTQAGYGQALNITEILSKFLPALYIGCLLWWDYLPEISQTLLDLERLREIAEASIASELGDEILQTAMSSEQSEGRCKLLEAAPEERSARATAIWIAGTVLAIAISVAAAKARGA